MPSASDSTAEPFMLLFLNAGPETHAGLTPEQKTAMATKWNDWIDGLVAQGKLVHGHPLGLGGRTVSGPNGERVKDGPYAEAKEVVGGYIFITAADLDEATAIARHCPGLPLGLTVEVRPVVARSPVLDEVRARPART